MASRILALATVLLLALSVKAGDVQLNVGGPQLVNKGFRCDTGEYANGGSKFTPSTPIKATGGWKDVYHSHRWIGTGDLEIKIPVPDGTYTVYLLWSESWATAPNVRLFTVKINGVLQANKGKFDGTLDVFKAAGGKDLPYFFNAGKKKSAGGFMTITLGRIAGKNNPMLSGVVLKGANADQLLVGDGSCTATPPSPAPSTGIPPPKPSEDPAPTVAGPDPSKAPPPPPPPGKCGEATVTTGTIANGNAFVMNVGGPAAANIGFGADNINYIVEADKGVVAKAPIPVIDNGKWGEPHQDHRYTKGPSLTYKIPVPAGNNYHVGLLFTESFMNAVGQRTFDILFNGELKAKAFDVFKANGGKNKPGYKGFNGIKSVGGFITIQFKKVVENPFVNGIFIKGAGAGTLAIGGPDAGPCLSTGPGPVPTSVPPVTVPAKPTAIPSVSTGCPASKKLETEFADTHFAHAVTGGPYVETDFKKQGFAKVNLDGTLSHSHFQQGIENGEIQSWEWMWTDPTNPNADKNTGVVTAYGAKVTQDFPLGVTTVTLLVKDQFCNPSADTTTVTVNSATLPGAYCYYYDYGSQNPATVPLPVSAAVDPKPQKGLQVGDINFGTTASFGDFSFNDNTFAVRCQFFLDVTTAAALQYKVLHSGPVKVYHAGVLVGSSDSKVANQMTVTKEEATQPGLQEWQILYLKPKATQGKLVFQFSNGAVIPPSTVRHDSGATLPVIGGLSKSSGQPDQLLKIFGTAFVNGVKVKFGNKDAVALETTPGSIEVRAPSGFAPDAKVPITVITEAGTSNAVGFSYIQSVPCGTPPLKFVEDTLQNPNGTPYSLDLIAVVKYGPDGRLYCGAVNSKIHALTVTKDLKVTKKCTQDVFENWTRAVLGIGFNPKSSELKMYFTTSTIYFEENNIITAADGWQNGKVKSVTMGTDGCFDGKSLKDVVTGLPVSNHDHAVQAIEFLPNGKMLIGVGGFTNGGISVPGDKLGGFASNPLSGAIVECPSSGVTNIKYTSSDPIKAKLTGTPTCTVYAAGFRNTFAMTYATNNKLYATDNGPNKSFGLFSTDCKGGMKSDKTIKDKLFLVQPGKCHGHPNINRGLDGSPNECAFEDAACVDPIVSGLQSSTNGVIEYRSNVFGDESKGNLFLSKFASGGNEGRVSRVILSGAGTASQGGLTNIFHPKSGLSIVEGPRGEMVMSRVYKKNFVVLKPSYKKPTCTFFISVMPRRGPNAGGNTVTVTGHNFGTTPSATFGTAKCTDVVSIDDDTFTCKAPKGTGQVKVVVTGSTGASVTTGNDYWYH